jgi:purine-binding chemotaxis protein CheW
MEQENNETNSYLTFKLGNEEFGVHVSQVLNILEMARITEVPKAPDYMKGVINLRGMVLPIIDTRIKFGMPDTEYTNNTCIIVMDLEMEGKTIHIGSIVDEVLSVNEIAKNQIEPPPSIGNKYKSNFISGMAKVEEKFVMLLDMQKILSEEELTEISDTARSNSVQKETN